MFLPAIETSAFLSLGQISATASQEARVAVGILGVLLLLWGPKSRKFVAAAPGMLLGALVAASLLADQSTQTQAIGTAAAGLAGGVIALIVQATALRFAGALIGAVTVASAYPLFNSTSAAPWWLPLGGAVLGMLIIPRLFSSTLKLLSPVFGAICLNYAAGLATEHQLYGLIGFSLAGFGLQAALGKRSTTSSEEA